MGVAQRVLDCGVSTASGDNDGLPLARRLGELCEEFDDDLLQTYDAVVIDL